MDDNKNNARDKDHKQTMTKDVETKQSDIKPSEKPIASHSK